MMSDYNVETVNDGLNEFNVEFHGPKESTVDILYNFVMSLMKLHMHTCYSNAC